MNILGKIFSGGATELVKGVGGVIDNLHTSKEEKLEAEQKIQELIANYETQMEKEISSRWAADMATVLMIFIDAGTINFVVESKWTDLLQLVLITVIGAYFGGRSLEKTKK